MVFDINFKKNCTYTCYDHFIYNLVCIKLLLCIGVYYDAGVLVIMLFMFYCSVIELAMLLEASCVHVHATVYRYGTVPRTVPSRACTT